MEPVAKLTPPNWIETPGVSAVVAALGGDGGLVRFVGGCVRDSLAGRPIKDIDLATSLRPEAVMQRLEAAGIKAVPTGLKHGTVTAVSRGETLEVTTLREDVETDGRHATVAFTDCWQADAARRDLTMNALSLTPGGALYDPFGGAADLAAGRIRFVGDPRARIQEDYLRLLRFFRFHAHYGKGPPDAAGLKAATALAPGMARLSAERVRDELLKLLGASDPTPVIDVMEGMGILAVVLPEGRAPAVLTAILALERHLGTAPQPLLRLAALVPGAETVAEALGRRLRLSNRDRDHGVLVERLVAALGPGPSALALGKALHGSGNAAVSDAMLLSWARADAGQDQQSGPVREDLWAEIKAWRPKRFPLKGEDLLARGLKPGPPLGQMLEELEDWWLEQDRRPNRKACLVELERRVAED